MTTFPLPTLAAQVTAAGISAPSFPDILQSLQTSFRLIFGSDAYVEPDSQDGQWISIIASAINDSNNTAIAVYNSFSPITAQGVGLSLVVKINGIARHVPTNSTADLTIVGVFGTTITNGKIGDILGNRWSLPASVTIPAGGLVVITATCDVAGAVSAPAASITNILTPTLGWQTANNVNPATIGAPVETDAALRQRQSVSTALTAETPLKAILGSVASLTGVLRIAADDNDTGTTDANGVPAHSLAMIVEGGDAQAIAQAIFDKKGPGAQTYGTTTETVVDPFGVPKAVNFYRPTPVAIAMEISLHPLAGYASTFGDAVEQAAVDYVNSLSIGDDVVTTRLYVPCNLYFGAGSSTFEITLIRIKKVSGGSFSTADIVIAFNEVASAALGNVTLLIV